MDALVRRRTEATFAVVAPFASTVRTTVPPETVVNDYGWAATAGPPDDDETVRHAAWLVTLPPSSVTVTE